MTPEPRPMTADHDAGESAPDNTVPGTPRTLRIWDDE
jgi:hypothetical protein